MKQLDPKHSDGLLALLRQLVEHQLTQQRDRILQEFSLDNQESALSRLIRELTAKHGDLNTNIQNKINEITKELSLNEENSALNRLVRSVTLAQSTITREFSLDSDSSSLSKLKRELMTVLEAHVKTNADFQDEVKLALRELAVRRREEARSTEHGKTFENILCEFIHRQFATGGDLVEFVGDNVGIIANCRKGDVLLKLGCDTAAPGAKVIIEAKEDRKYNLSKALQEIEEARKNREAQVGIFVFSTKTAPQNLRPIARHGNDVVVLWNAEDPLTDSFLWAALEFARLICFRSQQVEDSQASDFQNIEKLIANIEKRAANLDKIRKYAETAQSSAKNIQSAAGKIIKRSTLDKRSLDQQINRLRRSVVDLRQLTSTP
jgi:hypothetical protein